MARSMVADPQPAASGTRRAWGVRVFLGALVVAILFNLWNFTREQQGDRRLRLRAASDVDELAARSSSKSIRYHHGSYYRLARDLRGATLHMDPYTADLHRWALEGLGQMKIAVSKRAIIRLGARHSGALIDQATYQTRLDDRRLSVLLQPGQREYVVAWVGRGEKARMLILPLARFTAASGKL